MGSAPSTVCNANSRCGSYSETSTSEVRGLPRAGHFALGVFQKRTIVCMQQRAPVIWCSRVARGYPIRGHGMESIPINPDKTVANIVLSTTINKGQIHVFAVS